jgi:hypothetical protein
MTADMCTGKFPLVSMGGRAEGLACADPFEDDSADTCAGKFPLVSMGGRAEGLTCADPALAEIRNFCSKIEHLCSLCRPYFP